MDMPTKKQLQLNRETEFEYLKTNNFKEAKMKTNTIEEAKKFINAEENISKNLMEIMVAYADQYSTPQEGRGRYVTDEEIEDEAFEVDQERDSHDRDIFKYAFDEQEAEAFITGAKWMRDQIFTSPPEMEREWISVDERLPEHGQRCIVVQNPKTTATRHSLYAEYDAVRKRFTNVCSTIDGIHLLLTSWADIIFWQPLPSPPRSVGDKPETT